MTLTPSSRQVEPRWYFIPMRVVLVTFLVTLLSFAVSLLAGILWVLTTNLQHDIHPDLALAYRHFAFPAAMALAAFTLITMTILEVRNFRQARALSQIARSSRQVASMQ
jgi:hypothetical protein